MVSACQGCAKFVPSGRIRVERPKSVPSPTTCRRPLRSALRSSGIDRLYSHQAEAWAAARSGHDFVVTTATASGKTLAFLLPIIEKAMAGGRTHALLLYPTKALAHDQRQGIEDLIRPLRPFVNVDVFDGDTPQEERQRIRRTPPTFLIANPDILHHQQLARHDEWSHWWSGLDFIVLDEAHYYRGVFGSHIAHVFRRMRRIARHHGADPLVFSASATIANPGEHVGTLTGRDPVVVANDGSPQPARRVVLWEPVFKTSEGEWVLRGAEEEAARLIAGTVNAGHSCIAFTRSRRAAEKVRRAAERRVRKGSDSGIHETVASYRAGYTAERRRSIESGLRNGAIKAVVATNALELGIDIGALDIAILSTYPGSVMAFRQQAGRAGRRDRPALVVVMTTQAPLDQYFADHPELLFDGVAEAAAVDRGNPHVAWGQLGCAARELPLTISDRTLYGDATWRQLEEMEADGLLRRNGPGFVGPP